MMDSQKPVYTTTPILNEAYNYNDFIHQSDSLQMTVSYTTKCNLVLISTFSRETLTGHEIGGKTGKWISDLASAMCLMSPVA